MSILIALKTPTVAADMTSAPPDAVADAAETPTYAASIALKALPKVKASAPPAS